MLTKLLNTDNMSVVWEYQKKQTVNWNQEATWLTEYIYLVFSIHINWKLKTFSHYIELERQKFWEWLWLKNYEGWYILYNTLTELWYIISDFDWWLWWNVINQWIDKCIELTKEPDIFQM